MNSFQINPDTLKKQIFAGIVWEIKYIPRPGFIQT